MGQIARDLELRQNVKRRQDLSAAWLINEYVLGRLSNDLEPETGTHLRRKARLGGVEAVTLIKSSVSADHFTSVESRDSSVSFIIRNMTATREFRLADVWSSLSGMCV